MDVELPLTPNTKSIITLHQAAILCNFVCAVCCVLYAFCIISPVICNYISVDFFGAYV